MKILFLSREFPFPPHDGNLLPIFHFMRCLAPRVQFTLLTLRPADELAWEQGVRLFESWGVCVEAVRVPRKSKLLRALDCLLDGRWWINRFYERELALTCRQLLEHEPWDLVHSEGILSAQHLPLTPSAQLPPHVLIARDCLSLAHRRAAEATGSHRERTQIAKIAWMERSLYTRAQCVLAISEIDRAAMQALAPTARFELLPNGIDLNAFHPMPEREQAGVVMFSGAMDFTSNEDAVAHFARNIWPTILAERPQARFVVAGRHVPQAIQALNTQPGIEIRGEVPSMPQTLAEASVVIAPLLWGTGMKNKVLEGAAMARAMVVTPVALEGIELQAGRDVIVAEDDTKFTEAVIALLDQDSLRQTIGQAARAAVETRYGWEAMAERLGQVYTQCTQEQALR